jgi:hypothetical protein
MAVGILTEVPEGSEEQYFDVNRQMFGGKNNPDEPPQGLIVHTAGTTSTGGFRIFDVWESQADFERFMKESVVPAMEELGIPMQGEPEIYELSNVVVGAKVTAGAI